MGVTTPNIGIYIPAAGETNYDASVAAGFINIDQHDHSGGPNKGVPITTAGIAPNSITYNLLNANVADNDTGIGTDGSMGANQLSLLGLLKNLYALSLTSEVGIIAANGPAVSAATITGTTNQIAVAHGTGYNGASAANPTISLAPITSNVGFQPAFCAVITVAQTMCTGNGFDYPVPFPDTDVEKSFVQASCFTSPNFKAPITGVYSFTVYLSLTNIDAMLNTEVVLSFVNNTSSAAYSTFNGNLSAIRNTGGGAIMSFAQICKMTAGDTLTVHLKGSGNISNNINISDGVFAGTLMV